MEKIPLATTNNEGYQAFDADYCQQSTAKECKDTHEG